jgi:hypothetical protein
LHYFPFESVAKSIFLDFQIMMGLQVHPKHIGRAKQSSQPQSDIRGYWATSAKYVTDAPSWHADTLRQVHLGEFHRFHEFDS